MFKLILRTDSFGLVLKHAITCFQFLGSIFVRHLGHEVLIASGVMQVHADCSLERAPGFRFPEGGCQPEQWTGLDPNFSTRGANRVDWMCIGAAPVSLQAIPRPALAASSPIR